MSILGCLETAQIRVIRAGSIVWASREGVADAMSANWNRIADDISIGSFLVSLDDSTCCPPPIHAKSDLMEYIRNGVVEWAGQIQRVQDDGTAVTLEAYDLLGMYQRRVIHSTHNITAELTSLINTIRVDADASKAPPLAWSPFTTGISADLDVLASDYRYAWEAMKDIAGLGLDITAVGARCYYGDLTAIPLRQIVLNDKMIIGNPTTGEAGEGVATRVIVKGDGGLVGIYPPGAPTIDARYGIEEMVIDASSITSQATLDAYAQSEYDLRSRVPRFAAFSEGAWLSEDTPYALAEFIPGRMLKAELRAECSPVSQEMRLSNLTYALAGGAEQIRAELAPVGTAFSGSDV